MMAANKNKSSKGNRMLKVVLIGDGGVGKSSLMNCFVNKKFDPVSFHTIGVEFLNKDIIVDGQVCTMQIWDTAGQERFKSLRTPFYRGADCCLLTYDVTDHASFKSLEMWQKEFFNYANVLEPSKFPFIVLGNKIDINNRRAVGYEEAESWCNSRGMLFYETSAKDATNVETAFIAAARKVIQLDNQLDLRRNYPDTVDLTKKSANNSSCC